LLITRFDFATELDAKDLKLFNKGYKIASLMCVEDKLPKSLQSTDEIIVGIKSSKACKKLSKSKLKALAYYIKYSHIKKATIKHTHPIIVPNNSKCPVCGMFVYKHPKWAAKMVISGKEYYFDGVKDMMKYYIFDADFPYPRDSINSILVTDFYTLEGVDAKKAYYVLDSNMYGPMGHELIPFENEKEAKNFMIDHRGAAIVRFADITAKMVMALDGIDYE